MDFAAEGQSGEHDGQVRFDRLTVWLKIGRAPSSVLLIRKEASTCHNEWQLAMTPQAGIRSTGMLVTTPSSPPAETPVQGGVVQDPVAAGGLDESG